MLSKYFYEESNDVFDYDSNNYIFSSITSSKPGYIIGHDNKILYVKEQNFEKARLSKVLIRVKSEKDTFSLSLDQNDEKTILDYYEFMKFLDERAWIVTRQCFCKEINVSINYYYTNNR